MTWSVVRSADGRWDVPSADALKRLAKEPLPLRLRASAPERSFLRDVFYDTPDFALRSRGVTCRVRLRSDGSRDFMVSLDGAESVSATDADGQGDVAALLAGTSEPSRLLRSVVNPAALGSQLELEVERYSRSAWGGWWRRARFALEYDIVTVRGSGLSRSFQEIALRVAREGRPAAARLTRAISEEYGLRALTIDRRERGEQLRSALESEALARRIGEGRWVALAALDGSLIATIHDGHGRRVPTAEGSGEEACRHLLRMVLGSGVGTLELVTTALGDGRMRSLEVWVCTRVDRSAHPANGASLEWIPIETMLARVGTADIDDAVTLAALTLLSRSAVLPRLLSLPSAEDLQARGKDRRATATPTAPRALDDVPLLDGEVSLLAFNARVLALAEDAATPLLERLRFLSIVASNLDEFFSVRVGGLKYDGSTEDEPDAGPATETRLARLASQARALIARQAESADACLRQLAASGVRLRDVNELTAEERAYLQTYFRSTVLPYLTPRAITATPGHSLPIVGDRALCFAVGLRESPSAKTLQLAELAVPGELPRFVSLHGRLDFVALEDLIRRELPLVYRGRFVEYAHLFRVTRYADLGVDEQRAGNLTQAVEEHSQHRRHQPIVRVEVERAMPPHAREALLRELQLEPSARRGSLNTHDIYEIPGMMDLEALRQLADLPLPALAFPPFRPKRAVAEGASLWDEVRQRDILLHHPYEEFSSSVVRFFDDAADDPAVASIKVTLYRAGERSPIAEALKRAAQAGKSVSVFVELKARFDEQRNVRWTRQLETSGVNVVHGIVGLKNHSKVALVVRREADGPRRYAHIGTGNYNAGTARVYTDLGLLTARESVCEDVSDFFNTLTGGSVPADLAYRECLVAPNALLQSLLARIDREAEQARAGRRARIRIKVNGLSDREVVHALYAAARAGVKIELVVRGICTICPGVPGLSENIRVVSLLGRFLEHARIYAFDNGDAPEYYIGSADLRPRNLRRRVEVLVPIRGAAECARLDVILHTELNDPTAWSLGPDGAYTRPRESTGAPAAQAYFAAESTNALAGATQ